MAQEKKPAQPEMAPGGRLGLDPVTVGMWLLAPVLFVATAVVLAAGFASMAVIGLRDGLAAWQGDREDGD